AVLMVGADRVGTFEEHRFILDTMSGLGPFEGMDRDRFKQLLRDTTDEVCRAYPTDGVRITDAGVSSLTAAVCDALTPELRVQALKMAADLARADGMNPAEVRLLEQLREGLDVDPEVAQEFLGGAA
ncbi:MAG: hypothetical protein GWN71_10020, partial [Gammaproteobacteria bacterium]|nr:tellurite resistance TerB family protein [Gemmatimonadota bacterium]NIU73900.1 hypothetical protein [Gammaproteobacteria bacterium]